MTIRLSHHDGRRRTTLLWTALIGALTINVLTTTWLWLPPISAFFGATALVCAVLLIHAHRR